MSKRKVIIELNYNHELAAHAMAAASAPEAVLDTATVPKMAHVAWDAEFAPTALPGQVARTPRGAGYESGISFDIAAGPQNATYVARAEIDDKYLDDLKKNRQVVGVFADVAIEPAVVCPGSAAVGTDADVDRLLCGPAMRRAGMDGRGVLVAIVDTGINLAHLQAAGRPIQLDVARSWVPRAGLVPGQAAVGHGTMCAFDAAIAAPRATFLDIQLLNSNAGGPGISGLLSDAVRAYAHLLAVMTAPRRPGDLRSMVVNNSWAMFHPSWDFPVGDARNYSDNPNHPFNRIVATLERAGADIVFAAGNCGAECPDGRCSGVVANTIYGANGHPSVITVAGVDIHHGRVGYSSQGPGRLARNKPDLAGYTHFRGSGVYAADGGTSAASPVVAGVVAAIRSRRPYEPASPATLPSAIRTLLRNTATDLSPGGFDFNTGFGVIGGCALHKRLVPSVIDPGPMRWPESLCRRYPQLCYGERIPMVPPRPPIPVPPIPPIPPRPPFGLSADDEAVPSEPAEAVEAQALGEMAAVYEAWRSGWLVPAAPPRQPQGGGCGCGGKG